MYRASDPRYSRYQSITTKQLYAVGNVSCIELQIQLQLAPNHLVVLVLVHHTRIVTPPYVSGNDINTGK